MKILQNWLNQPKISQEEKKKQQQKKSAQDLIPLRSLDSTVYVTDDYRIVQVLKVSPLNFDLMSNTEQNEKFEQYEVFLRTLHFAVQTTIVSQPVQLAGYVKEQKNLLEKTTNPYKKELLASYVEYLHDIETAQNMMQRQRYIAFDEPILGVTKQSYEDALKRLENKRKHVKSGLNDVGLEVQEINETEIARYFQTAFNYTAAQYRPIQTAIIPRIVLGGK